MTRRTVVRRLRYRGSQCRPVRVVARTRRHRLVYRGRISALALMLVLVVAALAVATVAGHLGVGAGAAGGLLAAWLGYGMRVTRLVGAGPRWAGPARPGRASLPARRRPVPISRL